MSLGSWWKGVVDTAASNQAAAALGNPVEAPEGTPAPTLPDIQAAAFTAPFEGFRSAPYQDVAGVWTYGYGTTRDGNGNPVTASTPAVSEGEARTLLARDLTGADHTITAEVRVPLTKGQRVALTDFIYNLGAGAFHGSTLLRKLNAGDFSGAAAEFPLWDRAGGKEVAGLLKRRQAERTAFIA